MPVAPAVEALKRAVAAAAARPRPTLSTALERELQRRVTIDAAAREATLAALREAPYRDNREPLRDALWAEVQKIDAANTRYLRSVLPARGWFTPEVHGPFVPGWAWLIVQHSSDWGLKRDVLQRLAPLAAAGGAMARQYALLHDRVTLHDGRRQRYGSQLECRDGRVVPMLVEDEASLEARRAAIGLEPMAAYVAGVEMAC